MATPPCLWLDATYLKQREGGRIVSVAAMIAVAVNTEGKRKIVGLHIGPCEAETFWSTFLKSLVRRGLRGLERQRRSRLVISDAHEGLKAAIRRVMGATWQRCRVHWIRNALACLPKGQQTMVAAALRQAFLQPDQAAARQTWRHVADQFRSRCPPLPFHVLRTRNLGQLRPSWPRFWTAASTMCWPPWMNPRCEFIRPSTGKSYMARTPLNG